MKCYETTPPREETCPIPLADDEQMCLDIALWPYLAPPFDHHFVGDKRSLSLAVCHSDETTIARIC